MHGIIRRTFIESRNVSSGATFLTVLLIPTFHSLHDVGKLLNLLGFPLLNCKESYMKVIRVVRVESFVTRQVCTNY